MIRSLEKFNTFRAVIEKLRTNVAAFFGGDACNTRAISLWWEWAFGVDCQEGGAVTYNAVVKARGYGFRL